MTIPDATRRRVDELTRAAVADGQAPGAVVGVARGDDVHLTAAGVGTLGGPDLGTDALFRITSMTKPVTAVVVLTLVADGLVDLDEPVDRLLPELADRQVLVRPDAALDDTVRADRAPTVRELLAFTWGFGLQGAVFLADPPWPVAAAENEASLRSLDAPSPAVTPDPYTWIARLGALPLMAQPGERWLYNTGTQAAGVLAARAADTPFDDLCRERVFEPLGMTDTAFWTADTARLVTAYARVGGELVVHDPPDGQWSRPPAFPDGSAGLLSTAADFLRFATMLRRGGADVLAPELVAELTRNQVAPAARANVWPGFDLLDAEGWGLGLAVHADGRYGWDGGFGTTWSTVPDDDLSVVVLTQTLWDENGPPPLVRDALAAARH
ncbi:serine hydrolase domain-containing protein [Jatrophihabitans sp. YIM 134969]